LSLSARLTEAQIKNKEAILLQIAKKYQDGQEEKRVSKSIRGL